MIPYAALAELVFATILGGECDKLCKKGFCAHFMQIGDQLVVVNRSTRFQGIWVAAKAAIRAMRGSQDGAG
ncbi:MAG: hypothetical protein Q8S56_06670 [Polaromonas sp.]|nr:hypothetical protein [Polaromonas sp.]